MPSFVGVDCINKKVSLICDWKKNIWLRKDFIGNIT